MKIYTKTGDDGTTGLFGGPRVLKNDSRIEACGTVDELNAILGMVRAFSLPVDVEPLVERIQQELFELGAELATPDATKKGTATIGPQHIARLEGEIDLMDAVLPPLTNFILPAGSQTGAGLHWTRSVCRRAERCVLTLSRECGGSLRSDPLIYLNRLSDWLFVAARFVNLREGVAEAIWRP